MSHGSDDDSVDLREKLQSEILNGTWEDLKPHSERDAVFIVAPDLDLLDAGCGIVADDVKLIGSWIQAGQITRPTLQQTNSWERDPKREFRFLIVQPYVLIQDLGH